MILFAIALLFAISAFLSIREDEEWLGHFVFPRNHEVSVFNKGGEVFQKWSLIPAKVIEEMPDSLTIKTDRYPGPYAGDVKKVDAVTMADAPKYFTSLIIKNSNNYLAWLYRAEVWLMNNDFDKSIQDFTEAIRLNHSNYTHTCRGIAWLEKQDYNKAIIDFDMAILLDPSIPESLINRGVAGLAKQEHNKAIKDFDDTLRLKPSFIDAFLQRGYARHHIHEYDKAIADYSETLLLG